MSVIATSDWVAGFRNDSAALRESGVSWLEAMRQRAFDRFVAEGWPLTKQENWRHTSLAPLAQHEFSVAQGQPGNERAAADILQSLRLGETGHWLVFVDGHFSQALSDVGPLPEGVHVLPLSQALSSCPEQVQAVYGDESCGSSAAALNLALATDGAFVSVPRAVELDLPVHLAFISTTDMGACFPRNLIVAESGAQATIVEHYAGVAQNAT